MSEEEILKDFVGILEEHFPEPDVFRPRDISLEKFVYINDEELDKRDEWVDDETVEFTVNVGESLAEELEPLPTIIPISAVDASSASLGETNMGVISAIRLAIWKQEPEEKPQLFIYGPYLAHITPENAEFIYNYFRKEVFGTEKAKPPSIEKMTDRLRNFFERLGQRQASRIIENGITLWDGSLRGGTVDTPLNLLRESVKLANQNLNSVVGVSKHSTLKTQSGQRILAMLEYEPKACFKDVQDMINPKFVSQIVGRVHVVKFTPDGFSFRVDVAPPNHMKCVEVLKLLKGNCTFYNGYPDPLRQVHVHAYFTPDELISLQNFAVEKYHMAVLRSFDIRRHILAPFG